ncbi:esterase B1-like [Sergentomyia squamirostris]
MQKSVTFQRVQTTHGPIKGVKKTSALGDDYFSFQSIPYAKPPVGDLRFRDPQPVEPWSQVIDSTKQGACCPGFNSIINEIQGSEDCLYINVFTKNLTPKKLAPVMIFIHGGAMAGSSGVEMYGPDFLLQKDIVLFSFNFRVGAFGFMSIDDPSVSIPGNLGMKDQLLAIKWCKANATVFGGDPDNVTLFGESLGACFVHYHMLSEHSRGLFHRAILQSGTSLNAWSVIPPRNWAERLARAVGWSGKDNPSDMVEFLRKADAKSIVRAQENLIDREERKDRTLWPFAAVIEPYVTEGSIIPKNPVEMCRDSWSNSMPIIVGGCSDEGLYFHSEINKYPELLTELTCENLVPIDLNPDRKSENCLELGQKIQKFYFGDDKPSMKHADIYIRMMTDKLFWHGFHRTILSRAHVPNVGPTYFYRFAFDSPTFNHYRIMSCGKSVRGVCHADDLSYVFKNVVSRKVPEATSPEFKTIQRMINMWVNFATTGDPNCDEIKPAIWNPVNKKSAPCECLNISNNMEMTELPNAKSMAFWDTLYPEGQLY